MVLWAGRWSSRPAKPQPLTGAPGLLQRFDPGYQGAYGIIAEVGAGTA